MKLIEGLEKIDAEKKARFYMPGHKGTGIIKDFFGDGITCDITEIKGADSLYESSGIIAETERMIADRYGAEESLISAQGSTLCIGAMVKLAVPPGGKLLVNRGCHRAVINAMVLLGIESVWLLSQEVSEIERKIEEVDAVFLTSPDYFGTIADIERISAVCKEYAKPLLIDNAHGAHLKFLPRDIHPITLGADLCCDSFHKTLPALTGAAVLHIGNDRYLGLGKDAMTLFGSSSPSYLIMASCQLAMQAVSEGRIKKLIQRLRLISALSGEQGIEVMGDDPCRLVLRANVVGYTGAALGEYLRDHKIEPELAGGDRVVLLPSIETPEEDFVLLEEAIAAIPSLERIPLSEPMTDYLPERRMSLRDAALAEDEEVSLETAVGRVMSSYRCAVPPCTPLCVPGEMIDEKVIKMLKDYGISKVKVVK